MAADRTVGQHGSTGVTPEPVHVQAALGVAGALWLLALSATAFRAAVLRGWPIGLAVLLMVPPISVVAAPVAVVSAWLNPPAELRARGGGVFRPGAFGGLYPGALLLGLALTAAAGLGAFSLAHSAGISGEPMQAPILRALLAAGLVAGMGMSVLARRVAFLEALWVTAAVSLAPVFGASRAAEMFTYGTAPAYYAVILLTGALLVLLAIVLGGSLGYLIRGDGETQVSWNYETFIGRRFLMGKRGGSVVGTLSLIHI